MSKSDLAALVERARRFAKRDYQYRGGQPTPAKMADALFDELADALSSTEALLRRAGEVLKPFADKAEKMPVATSDERKYTLVTVDDCRAARTLASEIGEKLK